MKTLAIAYQIVILSGLTFGLFAAIRFKQKTTAWILGIYILFDLIISAIIVYTGKI